MNDEKIVKLIKNRDEKGLRYIIDIYGGLITSIVRKHLYNMNDKEEECIDDVLLSVWNKIDSFDSSKNTLKNWIGAIAQYRAIDYKRKYVKLLNEESINELELKSKEAVDCDLLNNELKEEVEVLLSNLKEKDKEIFKQRYLEDKSIEEIAKELLVDESVVYNRLSRGKKKLKTFYQNFITN